MRSFFERFKPEDEYERCGLILGVGRYIELPNTHDSPEDNFSILARDVYEATVHQDNEWLGFWHTHPGRDRTQWEPSINDVNTAGRLRNYIHVVYHPFTRRLTTYDEIGSRSIIHMRHRLRSGRIV